jgi:hypothetical protein
VDCLLLHYERRVLYAISITGAENPNEHIRNDAARYPPPVPAAFAEQRAKRLQRGAAAAAAAAAMRDEEPAPQRVTGSGAAAWTRYLRSCLGVEISVVPVWLLRVAPEPADERLIFHALWTAHDLVHMCPPLAMLTADREAEARAARDGEEEEEGSGQEPAAKRRSEA